MANSEILQIVVFSMFFGVALAALGDIGKALTVIDAPVPVMLKITGYVMLQRRSRCSPRWRRRSRPTASDSPEVRVFMGDFYIGLIILWSLLVFAIRVPGQAGVPAGRIDQGAVHAVVCDGKLGSGLSEDLDSLDRFGVKRKISSFVLPMGYLFNLDGSMMYCTFTLFIAQAYNIDLPISTQLTMMAILMLTSKGMAGVPRHRWW
jgi:hypothetical protein